MSLSLSSLLPLVSTGRSKVEDTRQACAPTCPSREAVPRGTSVPMPTQRRRERSEWEGGQRGEMEGRGEMGRGRVLWAM